MPRDATEAKGLLLASIREPDPVIFLEPKVLYRTSVEDVPDADYEIPLGTADVIREGTDITLVGGLKVLLFCILVSLPWKNGDFFFWGILYVVFHF